jgi:hypothetical protein
MLEQILQVQQMHIWGTYPTGFTTYSGFSAGSFTAITLSGDGLWGQNAQRTTYSAIGNVTYTLSGGVDYSSAGGMRNETNSWFNLITSYELFSNKDEIQVDYLIMGPGFDLESDSQAKANYLISIAESKEKIVLQQLVHIEQI